MIVLPVVTGSAFPNRRNQVTSTLKDTHSIEFEALDWFTTHLELSAAALAAE